MCWILKMHFYFCYIEEIGIIVDENIPRRNSRRRVNQGPVMRLPIPAPRANNQHRL